MISIVATAISLVTTLINIPLLIQYLGVMNYGYWVLFSSLGLLMTIIGVGMPQATLRFMSARAEVGMSSYFAPILKITRSQMAILVVFLLVFHYPILSFLHIPLNHTNYTVLSFLGASWVTGILLNVMYSVLYAFSRHAVAYSIQSLASLSMIVFNWMVLFLGYGLVGLSVVQVIITLGPLLVIILFLRKQLWIFINHTRKRSVVTGATGEILRYGFYQMIGQVAFGLIFNLDNIFASRFTGIQEMVYYNFRLKIFQMLTSVTLKPFWNYIPVISAAFDSSDIGALKSLLLRSLRISISLVAVAAIFYVFEIERLMTLWTGMQIPSNWVLDLSFGILLIFEQFLGNIAIVVAGMDLQINRHLTTLSVVESIANVLLTFYLGQKFGLVGIVLGTIIPRLSITIFFISKRVIRRLNITPVEILRCIIHPSWLSIPIILLFFLWRNWITESDTLWFLADSVCIGIISITVMLTLSLDRRMRSVLFRRILFIRNDESV